MTRRRIGTDDRRDEILIAALLVAQHNGYKRLTRAQVADQAQCSESLISAHFGTMEKFKRDIMRFAVRSRNLTVIAQGLVDGNPHAKKAPEDVKTAAMLSVV